jgi:hypothetical protein
MKNNNTASIADQIIVGGQATVARQLYSSCHDKVEPILLWEIWNKSLLFTPNRVLRTIKSYI